MDVTSTTDASVRAFRTWHPLLQSVLVAHVPLLLVFGLVRGVDPVTVLLLLVAPALAAVGARLASTTTLQAVLVAAGLSWCSVLLVLWSEGAAASHLHILLLVGLLALYRSGLPVAVVAGTAVVLHLGLGTLYPAVVYADPAALDTPMLSSALYALAVVAAVLIAAVSWRGTAVTEGRLADRVSSDALEKAEQRRRRELSAVYATVARRSQALLERQISVIERLEEGEQDPAALQQLFTLDHLATRMNREAASMLVLAGGEPTRRVIGTPPVAEVVRGAVGEIEDYTRVDLDVSGDQRMAPAAVAPVLHLLSELLENATAYSPPSTRVRVTGRPTEDGGHLLQIVDEGIGLDNERLEEFNVLLAENPDRSPRDNQRLGMEVVTRLAARLGVSVLLAHNEGRPGITVDVHLPAALLGGADQVAATPSEGTTATPSVTATETPVGARATRDRPVVPTAAPRWALATTRGGATAAATAPAAERRPAQDAPHDVRHDVRGPDTATVPVVAAATTGPGLRWSYAGHHKPRETARSEGATAAASAGRGSRTQVSRPAPRRAGPEGPDPLARPTPPLHSAPPTPVQSTSPTPVHSASPASGQRASTAPGATPVRRDADDPLADLLDARIAAASQAPAADPAGPDVAPEPMSRRSTQASEAARLLEGVGTDPAASTAAASTAPVSASPASTPSDETGTPPQPTPPQPTPPVGRARPTAPPQAGAPPVGTTPSGLPRRQRGATLPAGLREVDPAEPERDTSLAPVSRQESRSLLSSYQSRLQAGRRAAEEQQAGRAPQMPDADARDDDDTDDAGTTPTP